MGGEASMFLAFALDPADERRILRVLIEAREGEYNVATSACARFLQKAQEVIDGQNWNDQAHSEFTEALGKVHVLFRSAKRHDLLAHLTAVSRASAAESLAACEQVFRLLLNHEYLRASRALELQSDLLRNVAGGEMGVQNASELPVQ